MAEELIETVAVSDVFVTKLFKMERVAASCMRFYFGVEQEGERLLTCKLIVPLECINEISAERVRMMSEILRGALMVVGGGDV